MELYTAILCDFAQVREGLLFVSSGGITRVFQPPEPPFPRSLGLFLALAIEIGPEEINRVHEVRVSLTRQADASIVGQAVAGFQTTAPPAMQPGEALTISTVVPLGMMPIPAFGAYDVRASVDEFTPRILTVYLLQPPPGMQAQPFSGPPMPAPAPPQSPQLNREQRRHRNVTGAGRTNGVLAHPEPIPRFWARETGAVSLLPYLAKSDRGHRSLKNTWGSRGPGFKSRQPDHVRLKRTDHDGPACDREECP